MRWYATGATSSGIGGGARARSSPSMTPSTSTRTRGRRRRRAEGLDVLAQRALVAGTAGEVARRAGVEPLRGEPLEVGHARSGLTPQPNLSAWPSRTGTERSSRRRRRTRHRRRGSADRAPVRPLSNDGATGRDARVKTEAGRDDRHRDRGEEREHDERGTATDVDGIAARRRTPTPALPPVPWTSPMPKAPSGVRTVCVVLVLVRVRVKVEVPVPPANEQAEREEDDQGGDGCLGALLDALREVALEEEDRDAEDDERERMTEAPEGAELRGRAAARSSRPKPRASSPPRCDRDPSHAAGRAGPRRGSRPDRGAGREICDRVVEPEHRCCSPVPSRSVRLDARSGSALDGDAPRRRRGSRTHSTAGRARTRRPSNETRLNARRGEHGDQPDRGDRGGEAEAERERSARARSRPDAARSRSGGRRAPTGTAGARQRRRRRGCPRR